MISSSSMMKTMGLIRRRRIRLIDETLPIISSSIRARRFNLTVIVGLLGLFGFIIVTISFYSALQRHQLPRQRDSDDRRMPSITVFSAPRPFSEGNAVGDMQALAVRSWLAASPDVSVVLFGQHSSIHSFAEGLGERVVVESAIDFTFLGTPFFHSMVARSQASHSAISVLIDPETILLPDIITTLYFACKLNHDWFLVSVSPNTLHFPIHLDENGKHWLQQDGKKIEVEKLQEYLVQKRNSSNCGGRVIMAWNTGELPLHVGVLPPFLYGKGLHNEWLVNEVLASDFRFVFDATEVVSSPHPESMGDFSDKLLTDSYERIWEYEGNHQLSTLYGSLYLQPDKVSYNPFKLVKCLRQYFFIDPSENTMYSLEGESGHAHYNLKLVPHQEKGRSLLLRSLSHSQREKKCSADDISLFDIESQCSFMELHKVTLKKSMPSIFPFSLEQLLQHVADTDKSIVLAVAGDNYRDMLMSWVCRLRHLHVKNFLVCAIDPEMYQFSVLQGLPVFMDPLAPGNISFNDCHFGTECFKRVTKVKSRIVLQILKMGYNVLLSDVDVFWFDNPLPILHSFGPAILAVQSDEYNETGPINLPRRSNSGFYFARSDPATIAAMERVVKHASISGLSEQPSFYDVLCGEGGINRVSNDRCFEPSTNLTVHFLDRNLFPNGAYKGLWEKPDVRSACMKQGCIILHNNWIKGRTKKLERQVQSGLWDYDPSSRMCMQSWQKSASIDYF